jgi:rifampin ADP-ribosylating transferase
MTSPVTPTQPLYHGTRADLRPGDLIGPGFASNYGARNTASWVYLSGTLDAAIWGAELAQGDGRERIYVVEPTGAIFDDPNLTDRKFPGNPTKSYRSREPLRVTGEVAEWEGHPPERLQQMKDHVAHAGAGHRGDRLAPAQAHRQTPCPISPTSL